MHFSTGGPYFPGGFFLPFSYRFILLFSQDLCLNKFVNDHFGSIYSEFLLMRGHIFGCIQKVLCRVMKSLALSFSLVITTKTLAFPG